MLIRHQHLQPDGSRGSAPATGLSVRGGDGELLATGHADGPREAPRWTWRSPLLGTFAVEPVDSDPPRWFVTRPDGAPIGQLERRGFLLWHRLEVSDGRRVHLVVAADGTVRGHDGRPVARLRRSGDEVTLLDRHGRLPTAWRTLLVTASGLLDRL